MADGQEIGDVDWLERLGAGNLAFASRAGVFRDWLKLPKGSQGEIPWAGKPGNLARAGYFWGLVLGKGTRRFRFSRLRPSF